MLQIVSTRGNRPFLLGSLLFVLFLAIHGDAALNEEQIKDVKLIDE